MIWFVLYVAVIFAANWAVETWGIVPVGFGLQAPAAVYFVGLAFTLRDLVHRSYGATGAVIAVLIGSLVSYVVAPDFAVASGVAFLVSETLDLTVYSVVRQRSFALGVLVSNVVGATVDSWIFLTIAFGSLAFFWGQVVGKLWMTVLAVALILVYRGLRDRPTLDTVGPVC